MSIHVLDTIFKRHYGRKASKAQQLFMYLNSQEFPSWNISGKKTATEKSRTNTRTPRWTEQHALPITIYAPGLWKLVTCEATNLCEAELAQNRHPLKAAFGLEGNSAQFGSFLIIHAQVAALLLEIKMLIHGTWLRVYKQHGSLPEYQRRRARAHLGELLPSRLCPQRARSRSRTDRELSPDS